jgi:hypothetical protein
MNGLVQFTGAMGGLEGVVDWSFVGSVVVWFSIVALVGSGLAILRHLDFPVRH